MREDRQEMILEGWRDAVWSGRYLAGRYDCAAPSVARWIARLAKKVGLTVRRRGPLEATAGVGVHVIHHLTSLASLFVGVAIHLAERGSDRRAPAALAGLEAPVTESSANGDSQREPLRVLPG